jgi:hypothetical protein
MIPADVMSAAVERLRDVTAKRRAISGNIERESQGGPIAGDVEGVCDLMESVEGAALRVLTEVYYHTADFDADHWPDPRDVELAIKEAKAEWLYPVILTRVLDPFTREAFGGER